VGRRAVSQMDRELWGERPIHRNLRRVHFHLIPFLCPSWRRGNVDGEDEIGLVQKKTNRNQSRTEMADVVVGVSFVVVARSLLKPVGILLLEIGNADELSHGSGAD
jgi:hypothetical protein